MQPRLQVFVLVFSFLLLLMVVDLVRRGRLREEQALAWFLGTVVLVILSGFQKVLTLASAALQVQYAPFIILFVGLGMLLVIQLLHSISVSRLTNQTRDLAHYLAIQDLRLQQLPKLLTVPGMQNVDFALLNRLHLMGLELRRSSSRSEISHRTLELLMENLPASSGSLLLFDERGCVEEQTLIFDGETFNRNGSGNIETLEKGLAGWVFRNRKAVLVSNTGNDNRWLKRPWDEPGAYSRSALCVPLEVGEQLVGILTFVRNGKEGFTEADLSFVSAVLGVASLVGWEVLNRMQKGTSSVRITNSHIGSARYPQNSSKGSGNGKGKSHRQWSRWRSIRLNQAMGRKRRTPYFSKVVQPGDSGKPA